MNSSVLHHVRTAVGRGNPVLLLHPAGHDLTHWDEQIEALRLTREVVACDLAGHGLSPGGRNDMSFARQVEDLVALLDAVGAETAHVAGISYGSMIAQHFALAHPERTKSLTLIGSAAEFSDVARAGMRERAKLLRAGGMAAVIETSMARWFTDATRRDRPQIIDRATKTLLGDDAETHAQVWETVSTHNVAARLGEIGCPTLVLVGEADPSTTPAAARQLRDLLADARLGVIPDASHLVTLEQPALINSHLVSFLAQVDAIA